jgi:hypothetical protein
MDKNHVVIHQILHGYSNGHHLLEASISLSEESKQKMDMLSDFSNTEISEEFSSYFTGYFLEKEKLIVLAKTWYAYEMVRPGCVWTHSLILSLEDTDLYARNINLLLSLFNRPNGDNSENNYAIPIEISSLNSDIPNIDGKKLQYLIWIMLGQKPPNYIIANNSEEYINELLFVWFNCYSDITYNFSFITGTGSIKKVNTDILSLQFFSKSAKNNMANISNDISLVKNINDVQKFPPWVTNTYDLLINHEWSKLVKFKNIFTFIGNKNLGITMFIKLYSCFYTRNKTIDIYASLELIDKVFEKERFVFGNALLSLYFDGKFDFWGKYTLHSNLIIASLKFDWINISQINLEELIRKAFVTDSSNSKKIVNYLANLDSPEIQEKYLTSYAYLLTPIDLESFSNMDYSICNVLITINPTLANCNAIWKQTFGFQQGIFDCLKTCKDITKSNKELIKIVLNTSAYDFACDIYSIWKEESISIFLDYLLGIETLKHNNTSKMFEICKCYSAIAATLLMSNYMNYSEQQLLTLLKIVDPYSDKISFETLVHIFVLLQIKTLSEDQKNEVADWYLPFIICNKNTLPEEIIAFAVLNVHERLAKLIYPDHKWVKLKNILPDTGYFNQWDRCKRLRKAIKKKGIKVKELNFYTDDEIDIHLL